MTILKDLSLENNLLVGTALDDVCNLREMELQLFVTVDGLSRSEW
jgi:hypothetical protein